MRWREYLLFFVILVMVFVLVIKIFYLQALKSKYYQALSAGFSSPPLKSYFLRGEVFFRNGEPLAVNKFYNYLLFFPHKIAEKEKTAERIASIFHLDKEQLLEKMDKGEAFVMEVELTKETKKSFLSSKIRGIILEEGVKRVYPQKELAANVIGFLGGEGSGQYGIEQYYDSWLTEGKNLTLTLDYDIQFEAERILREKMETLKFERGSMLVMNPQNGEILAMAIIPTFDPNQYKNYANDPLIFKNPLIQDLYEPGSVFKPITMAIGLQEGVITPESTYEDPGEIHMNGWVIRNYGDRRYPGKITMNEVLEKSINTGAVFVQQKIPDPVFLEYLKKVGIFEKTNIDLFETYSLNKELFAGRPVNLATASFGQGVAVTPIQLAKTFSIFANGGFFIIPHLRLDFSYQKERSVFSSEVTQTLTKMLVNTIENGFSKKAKIDGYFIAGKTGTALQPNPEKRGYSNKTWQSFIGYLPAFSPRFLILVKLDDPQTKTAEYSALLVFREMAEYLIRSKQIPPDY